MGLAAKHKRNITNLNKVILSYLMQNRIREIYKAFVRNEKYEDFSTSIVALGCKSEDFQRRIYDVENPDDNGWTILQLSVKKNRHDFVEKLLQGTFPIIISNDSKN